MCPIAYRDRDIRLADLLLAMPTSFRTGKVNKEVHQFTADEGRFSWNLRTDDLERQSDETMSFIADLKS
jgi:hypothetical protein